ncbi:MAG: glycosyltransferase family 2 protein, partial [Pseudobdellovibrionaceae bacterium]
AATSEFVIFADADMSYPFVAVPDLIAPLREKKSDFVLGSRLGGTIEKGAMPWLNRNLGTPVLTFLLRNIYSLPTSDCNSGMRAFRKSTYENLKLSCPGMEYASEMLIRVAQTKTSYSEVPIHFRKDQRSRPPHLKRWQDGWRHLRFILGNSSSPLVASGTLGLGLVFFAIAITISFSSWFWPSQPIHFHTAFMCLALGTPFLLFFVTHVLVKLVRYESGIEQPPIILRLYRWSDRGYAFFGLCFLMFLGLLQSAFLVERWVSANFQNLFEIGALIRLIAIVILAAGLFCLDMGVGLIKLVKIQK